MNYKPLGHDVRHPFGCQCYRCFRKQIARWKADWDRMQRANAALRERLRLQEPKTEESE